MSSRLRPAKTGGSRRGPVISNARGVADEPPDWLISLSGCIRAGKCRQIGAPLVRTRVCWTVGPRAELPSASTTAATGRLFGLAYPGARSRQQAAGFIRAFSCRRDLTIRRRSEPCACSSLARLRWLRAPSRPVSGARTRTKILAPPLATTTCSTRPSTDAGSTWNQDANSLHLNRGPADAPCAARVVPSVAGSPATRSGLGNPAPAQSLSRAAPSR